MSLTTTPTTTRTDNMIPMCLTCYAGDIEKRARLSSLKVNFKKTHIVKIGFQTLGEQSIKTKWKVLWVSRYSGLRYLMKSKNISKDIQEIPQSRRTALLRHQEKTSLGTNKDKTNATHEITDTQTEVNRNRGTVPLNRKTNTWGLNQFYSHKISLLTLAMLNELKCIRLLDPSC